MNKLDKFLLKLDKKVRVAIEKTLQQIISGDILALDVKKLKGKENIYRIRAGRVRIIFKDSKEGNKIQSISFRDENTY